MAGKLIICFITTLALIQPFNAIPASNHKQEVIYRNSKGEYYTSDGVILKDQYPIYWRPANVQDSKSDQVVIVEPTITYTRQAEYSSTQASPSSTTFRASPPDTSQANFRPYDGQAAVAYYPYYIRASSNDRNDAEERRRHEESKRVVVDVNDPAYQRFVPRESAARDDRGETWYYYTETRPQSTSQSPPSSQPTVSSKSPLQFYNPNGTPIKTYYTADNKQVMDIHPNKYEIQVTELTTTTTSKPITTTDCPPYHPCNAVVYQQTTQCCKCYVVPNRCCPCSYPNN